MSSSYCICKTGIISFPSGDVPVRYPTLPRAYMSRADGQLRTAPKKHNVSLLTFIRNGLDLSTLSILLLASPELCIELMKIVSSAWVSGVVSWHMAVKTPTDPHLGARSLYIYTGFGLISLVGGGSAGGLAEA